MTCGSAGIRSSESVTRWEFWWLLALPKWMAIRILHWLSPSRSAIGVKGIARTVHWLVWVLFQISFKAIYQTLDLDKYFLTNPWHNNVLETVWGAIPHGNVGWHIVLPDHVELYLSNIQDHGQDTYQCFSNLIEYNLWWKHIWEVICIWWNTLVFFFGWKAYMMWPLSKHAYKIIHKMVVWNSKPIVVVWLWKVHIYACA